MSKVWFREEGLRAGRGQAGGRLWQRGRRRGCGPGRSPRCPRPCFTPPSSPPLFTPSWPRPLPTGGPPRSPCTVKTSWWDSWTPRDEGDSPSATFPSLREQKGRLSPDTRPWLGSVRPPCPASSQRGRAPPGARAHANHVFSSFLLKWVLSCSGLCGAQWPSVQSFRERSSAHADALGRQPLASRRRPGSQAAARWPVPVARPPSLGS